MTLANQNFPSKNQKGWTFELNKSHVWVSLIVGLVCGAIVMLGLLAWSNALRQSNANCTPAQIKLTDFSGAGMSVTCMPVLTYRDLKKMEHERDLKQKRERKRRRSY